MMTNAIVTSTNAVHQRLPSSSLPSKKRPIVLERIITEPPSREFVEQACKKIKRDLPTSKTLVRTPPPPTVTTRPTQLLSAGELDRLLGGVLAFGPQPELREVVRTDLEALRDVAVVLVTVLPM